MPFGRPRVGDAATVVAGRRGAPGVSRARFALEWVNGRRSGTAAGLFGGDAGRGESVATAAAAAAARPFAFGRTWKRARAILKREPYLRVRPCAKGKRR